MNADIFLQALIFIFIFGFYISIDARKLIGAVPGLKTKYIGINISLMYKTLNLETIYQRSIIEIQ